MVDIMEFIFCCFNDFGGAVGLVFIKDSAFKISFIFYRVVGFDANIRLPWLLGRGPRLLACFKPRAQHAFKKICLNEG
jgi:hypothetical protein